MVPPYFGASAGGVVGGAVVGSGVAGGALAGGGAVVMAAGAHDIRSITREMNKATIILATLLFILSPSYR
jgi:hypothetical protein